MRVLLNSVLRVIFCFKREEETETEENCMMRSFIVYTPLLE
jgi:hypothetical protein